VTWAIDQNGYSQRRACELIGLAPKTYLIGRLVPTMAIFVAGCASSRPTAVASATGAC